MLMLLDQFQILLLNWISYVVIGALLTIPTTVQELLVGDPERNKIPNSVKKLTLEVININIKKIIPQSVTNLTFNVPRDVFDIYSPDDLNYFPHTFDCDFIPDHINYLCFANFSPKLINRLPNSIKILHFGNNQSSDEPIENSLNDTIEKIFLIGAMIVVRLINILNNSK